jgi:hypothetical protein
MPQVDDTWSGGYIRKGVYIIRRSIGGRRYEVSTRCTTAAAAYKALESFEKDPRAFTATTESGHTTKSLFLTEALAQEFLDWCKVSKKTSKAWRTQQAAYLTWWGRVLVGRDLRHLHLEADVKRPLRGIGGRRHRINVLKAFMAWLRSHRDPPLLTVAQDVTLNALPAGQSLTAQHSTSKVLDGAALDTLLGPDSPLAPHWQAVLTVQLGTAWHVTEAQRFAVDGRIEKMGDTAVLYCPEHKTGAPIRVPVSEAVRDAAQELLKRGAFSYYGYWKALGRACKALGIPPVLPGRSRHTVLTRAIEAGASPDAVSEFARHVDARTRRKYTLLAVVPKVPTLR